MTEPSKETIQRAMRNALSNFGFQLDLQEEEQTNNQRIYGIIGAVIGDIVGSRFEPRSKKIPSRPFKLFAADCTFTDDSMMTIAIADALLHGKSYEEAMKEWGNKYPAAGYGGNFRHWLKGEGRTTSAGNGSGMRISPVGFRGKTLDEVLEMAKEATVPSHNSKEGIKAAQAIATSVFLARQGKSKEDIKAYVEATFKYDLNQSEDDIKLDVKRDRDSYFRAQYATPIAIIAFLNGTDYEDVVRRAVSYDGDTDTVACMAGSIAAAFYGVPVELAEQAAYYLPTELLDVINAFDGTALTNHRVTPPNVRRWSAETVVVYGCNADDTEGEKGFLDTHFSKLYNHNPMKGFPIHTIGTSMEVIKNDVQALIAKVKAEPEKTFIIEDVGIGKKTNLGVEVMAPLFAPLKDAENVFFVKEYWEYYNQ